MYASDQADPTAAVAGDTFFLYFNEPTDGSGSYPNSTAVDEVLGMNVSFCSAYSAVWLDAQTFEITCGAPGPINPLFKVDGSVLIWVNSAMNLRPTSNPGGPIFNGSAPLTSEGFYDPRKCILSYKRVLSDR